MHINIMHTRIRCLQRVASIPSKTTSDRKLANDFRTYKCHSPPKPINMGDNLMTATFDNGLIGTNTHATTTDGLYGRACPRRSPVDSR